MTLLPSPTPLELGLEAANDTYGRLAPKLASIPRIGRNETPSAWLPWVLVSKGLEDIVPYVRDMEKALREGPAWLRVRGTEPAIAIGIGWVDSSGAVAPADGRHAWYKFQVAFKAPPVDASHPRQLTGIINLSKSSWDELFRLYSPAFDFRPVRMDEHAFDAGGLMDDYSGSPRWDGGPLIAFGPDETSLFDLAPICGSGWVFDGASTVDRADEGLRYDEGRFGQRPPPVCGSAGESDKTVFTRRPDDTWPEVWPRGSWADAAGPTVWSGPYRRNDGTVATSLDDDTWPDRHPPLGSWRKAAAGQPIPLASESP